ncbi:MAG TPA: hypothetical protein DCM62_08000 [Bacteroidales bacterium]|nr:hypothetical protein [Bacteroidales bacterium]
MKAILVIVLGLFLLTPKLKAQEVQITTGVGYLFFGDGDFPGINYFKSLQFPVLGPLDLKIGLQIAHAADTVIDILRWPYNVFNFGNSLNLVITPVKTNFFSLALSVGGNWRYRSEIITTGIFVTTLADGTTRERLTKDYICSYDFGYNVDITGLFRLTERIKIGVLGKFFGYTKGSSFYSINFALNYRL